MSRGAGCTGRRLVVAQMTVSWIGASDGSAMGWGWRRGSSGDDADETVHMWAGN